jgi:hypothetical protein
MARFDFNLVIGDSYPPGDAGAFTMTFKSGPDVDNLVPYDLTNATIGGELSEVQGGPSLVTFEITKLNQGATPGRFSWRIPASQTAALERKRYFWRLFISWPGSNSKTTLLEGRVGLSYAH